VKILEKDLIIRARGYFILYLYKFILNFASEKIQQREFLKDNMNNTNNFFLKTRKTRKTNFLRHRDFETS